MRFKRPSRQSVIVLSILAVTAIISLLLMFRSEKLRDEAIRIINVQDSLAQNYIEIATDSWWAGRVLANNASLNGAISVWGPNSEVIPVDGLYLDSDARGGNLGSAGDWWWKITAKGVIVENRSLTLTVTVEFNTEKHPWIEEKFKATSRSVGFINDKGQYRATEPTQSY